MIVFFDTSALFKRYVAETGSQTVLEYCDKADQIVISGITPYEVQTTLCRRRHERTLDDQSFHAVLRDWLMDAPFYHTVPMDTVLENAAMQVNQHNVLRTLDVIQLASVTVSNADYFLVSDKKLCHLAQKVLLGTHVLLV